MRVTILTLLGLWYMLTPVWAQYDAVPVTLASQLQAINTDYDEQSPLLSADGQKLYFIRRGHPQNMGQVHKGDLWRSERLPTGEWSPAINVGGPLNTRGEDRAVGIDAAGQTLYLARENIVPVSRRGRLWQERPNDRIELIAKDVVWISALADLVLLSLDRPDGYGGYDLYLCIRLSTGQWSAPLNLGPQVNSSYNEQNGVLAADERSLYISSDRPGGVGGVDWYQTRRLDDVWTEWSAPQNLGNGVNSSDDDLSLSFTADGSYAMVGRRQKKAYDLSVAVLPDALRPGAVQLVRGQVRNDHGLPMQLAYSRSGDRYNAGQLWLPPDGSYALLLPFSATVHLQPLAEGYLGEGTLITEYTDNARLDRPADDALANLDLGEAYQNREANIAQLRLQLQTAHAERQALLDRRNAALDALRQSVQANTTSRPTADPELAALQHRYSHYLAQATDTLPPTRNTPQAYSTPAPTDELAKMKARFRAHYERQKWEEQQDSASAAAPEYLWDEPESFTQLQAEAEAEVRQEIAAEVWQDWTAKTPITALPPPVTIALQDEISRTLRSPAVVTPRSGQPMQELHEEIKRELRPQLKQQLTEQLTTEISAAFQTTDTLRQQEALIVNLEESLQRKVMQQVQTEELYVESHPVPIRPDTTTASTPEQWQTRGVVTTEQNLRLYPTEAGTTVPLAGIVFAPNSAYFKPESLPELDRLVDFLTQHPALRVEIGGHTNGRLSHAFSLNLSTHRAQAVAAYFVDKGIAAERLRVKGYGKTRPIADDSTLDGRQRNQRIEMTIL